MYAFSRQAMVADATPCMPNVNSHSIICSVVIKCLMGVAFAVEQKWGFKLLCSTAATTIYNGTCSLGRERVNLLIWHFYLSASFSVVNFLLLIIAFLASECILFFVVLQILVCMHACASIISIYINTDFLLGVGLILCLRVLLAIASFF